MFAIGGGETTGGNEGGWTTMRWIGGSCSGSVLVSIACDSCFDSANGREYLDGTGLEGGTSVGEVSSASALASTAECGLVLNKDCLRNGELRGAVFLVDRIGVK